MNTTTYRIDRCMPRPPEALGVTAHDRGRATAGYTLVWSRGTEAARLIDLDGNEVHRWSADLGINWHDAKLIEGGNLLVTAQAKGYSADRVGACKLLELAPDSSIVWQSDADCHHDAQRLANGNTLTVCNAVAQYPHICDEPLVYDYLAEIEPAGRIVWQWHFATHHDALVAMIGGCDMPTQHDWPHINTIESLPDTPTGRADARFREGNLLVSPRHMHCIFVIDRDTDEIVWQWGRGVIVGQHQPTMLDTGNILVFDNGHGPPMRGWSQVVELNPLTGEVVWQYRAPDPTDFWTPVGSGAQRLWTGNTLICAMNWAEPGRVFEVTPDGEIVWVWWNPDRQSCYRAARYREDDVARLLSG